MCGSWTTWISCMRSEPVVFLPGLHGRSAVFDPLRDVVHLGDAWNAWDLPPGGPRDAAAALAPRLERLGPAHLVTGSYGGLIALQLPPEKIRSLVMVGTCPHPGLLPPHVSRQVALLGALPSFLVRSLYRAHLGRSLRGDGVPPATRQRILDQCPGVGTLLERLDGALQDQGANQAPPNLLWVRGTGDALCPWDDGEVVSAWPGANVQSVPGGHRPWASHPQAFAAILHAFWSQEPDSD
jgi:pimeloyl-ACP methyl ester carboxylesterase